jgi:Family of unknown function (DUF6812)
MVTRYNEKGKFFTDFVTKEAIPVLVQTPLHRLRGSFYVQPEERLKDALNRSGPFLALTDVTVYDLSQELQYRTGFLALNKDLVQWVLPVEDLIDEPVQGEGI